MEEGTKGPLIHIGATWVKFGMEEGTSNLAWRRGATRRPCGTKNLKIGL